MKGTLYAVGVGPGDPDLMTVKAIKTLEQADVIACPSKEGKPGIAYGIAEQAYANINKKEVLLCDFPMENGNISKVHKLVAQDLMKHLDAGKDIAFLTLGDPCIYSTFSYIYNMVMDSGYEVQIINGIPSFCAASAKILQPLSIGQESVLVTSGKYVDFDGTLVIMKAGSKLKSLKNEIENSRKKVYLIENCGMLTEQLYIGADNIPDKTGYFSILIVKPIDNYVNRG
ncbi:MAG: precorrin-2 C(20)-methyltransferase [Lachnospiraceae bacterium]|nr:precorrin-2 C(20)-methyltransferase [Lachnospiraceae bacterium]